MSAEFEKGFSVRVPAWHKLAKVLDEYPGREEAMIAAGHNFNIIEAPVIVKTPQGIGVNADDWKGLVRDDNSALIAVVKKSYTVVPNSVIWDITDAILKDPAAKYETAGILKGGAILWVLARLNEPAQVPGDDSLIFPYAHVYSSHDGTSAVVAQATSVRVICWNTHQAADAETKKSGCRYSFRHTKNVMEHVEDAREALGLVRDRARDFMDLARELGRHSVNEDGVKDFLRTFIPDPPADVVTERAKTNVEDARTEIAGLLQGRTISDAHRRTSWGLYCAGVEYLDHVRRYNTDETYFRRTMFDMSMMKPKLAKLALKVASN